MIVSSTITADVPERLPRPAVLRDLQAESPAL
jgi:hypothetical protein